MSLEHGARRLGIAMMYNEVRFDRHEKCNSNMSAMDNYEDTD